MKTLAALFTLMTGLLSFVLAQPVLNYHASHSIGTTSVLYSVGGNTTVMQQTGAGVVWDLSAATVTASGTFDFVDPATTPYAATYPTANLAMKIFRTGQPISYNYLIDSPTELNSLADGIGSSSPTTWSQYDKVVQYPFNFNDTYNSVRQSTTGSPESFSRTYDTYGTLIINGKTFSNVIRVKKNPGRSIWFTTSPVLFPVIIEAGNSTYMYNESVALLSIPESFANAQVSVYPNPAKSTLTVALAENPSAGMKISIRNAVGQEVTQVSVNAMQTDILLNSMPAGIYLYFLYDNQGGVKTGKFVVD